MLAQLATIILHHFQRAAYVDRAGFIRVVVRRQRAQAVFHRAFLLEKSQCFATGINEGLNHLRTIVRLTDDGTQVGFHLVRGPAFSCSTGLIGVVNPHRAARNCRGAAKVRRFFQH